MVTMKNRLVKIRRWPPLGGFSQPLPPPPENSNLPLRVPQHYPPAHPPLGEEPGAQVRPDSPSMNSSTSPGNDRMPTGRETRESRILSSRGERQTPALRHLGLVRLPLFFVYFQCWLVLAVFTVW